jgi:50S ribosomal protein L16 3-hydroxylase
MSQFLMFLEERLTAVGGYSDPDLSVQAHPAKISAAMMAKVERVLGEITWTGHDIAEFLGSYLTEPKPHVLFAPPHKPLSATAFSRAARRNGVELAPASLMLYGSAMLFINGEACKTGKASPPLLRRLADTRRLPGRQIPLQRLETDLLYRWYRAGYIKLSKSGATG